MSFCQATSSLAFLTPDILVPTQEEPASETKYSNETALRNDIVERAMQQSWRIKPYCVKQRRRVATSSIGTVPWTSCQIRFLLATLLNRSWMSTARLERSNSLLRQSPLLFQFFKKRFSNKEWRDNRRSAFGRANGGNHYFSNAPNPVYRTK